MRVAIVAGEASGDTLGAHLMAAMRAAGGESIHFVGIGGPKMAAAGMDVWYPAEKLAVRGYVEVLRQYREIARIRRRLKSRLLAEKPALFIGIDAPDFNLGLEAALRRRGVPTLHYVGPSVWAWRAKRMRAIAQAASHVLLLFPFEKPLYDQAGIPATYVGHPLASEYPLVAEKAAARKQLNIAADRPVVALLPGSRQSELKLMGNLFVRTARALSYAIPRVQLLVPLASRETRTLFEAELYKLEERELPLRILFGHADLALTAADAAIVASGTATLDALLAKTPMVVTYRVPDLTYRIMWPRRLLPYVSLPNVLAGRFLVPELLQDDATPANLARACRNLLQNDRALYGLQDCFRQMHEELSADTSALAAGVALRLAGNAPGRAAGRP